MRIRVRVGVTALGYLDLGSLLWIIKSLNILLGLFRSGLVNLGYLN